jgi:TP901 family phage tail tape measure protein
MAEQIKVGVVLEFQGLKGIEDIPKNVKSLLTTIQANVNSITSSINFDSSSLTSFAASIQELNSVIAELKVLASKPITVSIDLSGQSITAAAAGFADAFVEALTKARIPKGFASKMAASVAAASAEGGGAGGADELDEGRSSRRRRRSRKAPEGPPISEFIEPDPTILKNAARDSARSARVLGESGRDFMRELIDSVEISRKEFAKRVGRDVSILNQNAIQAVNKDIERELKGIQKDSAFTVKKAMGYSGEKRLELAGQYDKTEKMEADPASSEKEVEAERIKLKTLQEEYQVSLDLLKIAKQQNIEVEIQYNRVKDRNKLLERVGKLDRSMTDSRAELNTALKLNVDDSVKLMNQPVGNIIETQVRILETYGQRLAGFRREATRAMDSVTTQLSISQNTIQDIKQEMAMSESVLKDPSVGQPVKDVEIGKLKALNDMLVLEEDNARKLMAAQDGVRDKIEEIGESAARFKTASNLFRVLARTAEEPLRVFEKTQRTSERLSLSFQSLVRTYADLTDTVSAGGELGAGPVKLSQNQAIEAKRFIEAREKQIQDIQKNIQDQMVNIDVFTRQIEEAQSRAATSPTLFASDPNDPDNQINIDQQAAELLDGQRKKAQTYIADLKRQLTDLETIGEGQDFDNLRISVEQFASFDELSQKIDNVSKKVKNLGNRARELADQGEIDLELGTVSDLQLGFDSRVMAIAQKDFENTSKEVEDLRNQIAILEDAGFDTTNLRTQLNGLSLILRGTEAAFGLYGKAVDKISETRTFANRIENLNSSIFGLGDVVALSTDELSQFAREISDIEKEVGKLDQEIAQLESEYRTLEKSNDSAAAATRQAIDELKRLRDAAKKQVFGDDFARNQEIIQLVENLEKAQQGTVNLARSAARMTADIERASAQLSSTNPEEQLQGVNTFKRLGSEAASAVADINDYIFSIKQAADRTGGLTSEQGEQIAQLERLRAQFESTSGQIRRGSAELDRVRHSAERAGQGMELYSREVANSVLEGLKFVQAATLIGSVLGGIRTVFDSVIESSKVFARAMTVLSSTSMNLTQIYSRLKKEVTDTAIAFGVPISEATEIIKQFGSAGFTAEEAFAALTPTMKTLIATSSDAEQLARSTAGIYRVFGDELKAAGGEAAALARINDVLVVSYRDHSVEMDELTQGYKFTANSAKLAGFSFEDTTALLSVLNDNMLKSGMAGRSLNAVFAQLAAKSDQAGKVFGFTFDPNKSLGEQFIPFLETVNKRIGEGAILTSELDKQFKFFDRQGAKGFQTLVTNLDDAKWAMNNFKNESEGAADELSDIVRDDFGNQFERARQAALAFGKDFIEPLKPLFIALADIVVALREISARNPEVAATFGWVFAVVGGFLFLVSSIKAVWIVFTVLAGVLGQYTVGAYKGAQAAYATGMAAEISGGRAARAGALWRSYAAALGITKVAADGTATSISVLGRTASAGAGWVGVLLTALTFLIPIFASFSTSSAEVNREFEGITASIKQLDREMRSLDKFAKSIDHIEELSKNSGISHEIMGQKIRDAFDQAGDKAVNYGLIIGRTNKQIGQSTQEIINKTREQIAELQRLQQVEKDRAREKGRAAFSTAVSTIINESSIEGDVARLESVQKELNSFSGAPAGINLSAGGIQSEFEVTAATVATAEMLEKREAALEAARKAVAESAKNIVNDIQVKALEQGGNFDSFVEAYEQAKKDIDSSPIAPELKDTLKKQLEGLISSFKEVKVTIDEVKDVPEVFEGTIGTLNTLSKEIGGIGTDTALFEGMINGAITLNEELTSVDNQLGILNARLESKNNFGVDARTLASQPANIEKFQAALRRGVGVEEAMIPVQLVFNKEETEKSIQELGRRAQNFVEKANQSGNLNRLLGEEYKDLVVEGSNEADQAAKTIDNIVQKLILTGEPDILGNTQVSAEEVARLVEVIATATGRGTEEAKAFTGQLLQQINASSKLARMEKLRQQTFAAQLKLFQQQANVQNIMNDRGRAGAEASIKAKDADRQKLEVAKALRDAGQTGAADLLVAAKNGRELAVALEVAATAASEVKPDPQNPEFAKNVQEASKSIIQARADASNAFQGIAMADRERLAATKRLDVEIVSSTKNLNGQVSAIQDQIEATRKVNRINIDLMTANRRLNGSYIQSLDAINELKGSYKELIDIQKQLEEAYAAENQSIFSTLEAIDKLLYPKAAGAGLESRLGGALEKISGFENKLKALNKDDENYQSERISLTEKYVAAIGEALDVQKEFKEAQKAVYEAEKKSKDFTDQRLNLYKEMNDFLSGQSNTAQKMLQDALKRQFEAEKQLSEGSFFVKPANVVAQLAKAFGVSVTEVELKFESFAERYSELVSKGQMTPLQGLGGDIDNATKAVKNLGTVNNDLTRSLETVRDAQLKVAMAGFQNAIKSGDVDKAKEYFDQVKAINDQRKEADANGIVQIDKYMSGVEGLASMAEDLSSIQFKEEQELKLRLNVLNPEALEGVAEQLRGKLENLKLNLKEVVDPEYLQKVLSGSAEAASAALRGDLEMVRNEALGESPLKKSMDLLKGAMNDLKDAIVKSGGTSATMNLADVKPLELKLQIDTRTEAGNTLSFVKDLKIKDLELQGFATGGKINGPGTKKSDSIMAMLSRGEYVVQAEAVDYYGTAFLNSVNSKSLKRFSEGSEKDGIKIAASGNEEYNDFISVFPNFGKPANIDPLNQAINNLTAQLDKNVSSSGSYTKLLAQANQDAKDAALKSLEKAVRDEKIRKGQESVIYKTTVAVGEALSSVGDAVSSSLENILNLSFVVENIEALDNYKEKLSEIGKTFDGQMTEIEDALQKNKSSYFDYLNSLQDAEKERIQSLIDAEKEYQEELKTTKEVAGEAFNSLFTGLAGSAQSGIGAIGGKLTEGYMEDFAAAEGFWASAGNLGLAGVASGGTALASGATGVVGDLVTLASEDPAEVSKFIDDFIEQLPQIAESLITNIVENLPKLIDALVEMMPVLFETIANALPQLLITLANAIPELLVSFLTALIDNLPQIIQGLVQALVIAIPKIVVALIAAAIQLFLKLPEILFSLWTGIIDGLVSLFTDGEFWLSIGKSIADGFAGLFEGIGDFFGGIFHEGGVVKGGEDVPIIAQGGEGVLSRQGMRALGGAGALDKLNSGVNPFIEDINRYHSGGVVGEAMTRDAIINRQPSVSSSSVSTSNNVSVNVTVNGSMDSRQIDQMTNKLVNEIDGKLSKKVQDRDSRLARSMANRK